MSEENAPSNFLDWLNIAKKDWRRAGIMLGEGDAEAAGFFLQQSLEKFLKAYLLKNGWGLRKIHELDALLDDAMKYDAKLDAFRDLCERISGYYFAERYPPLGEIGLTCEEIQNDLKEEKKFILAMFPGENLK